MIDDRPTLTLTHSQIDAIARWALKDSIDRITHLIAHGDPDWMNKDKAEKNLQALSTAYLYFGGEAEGDNQ